MRLNSTRSCDHHGRRLNEHVPRADVRHLVRQHALELVERQRLQQTGAHADGGADGPRPAENARGNPSRTM